MTMSPAMMGSGYGQGDEQDQSGQGDQQEPSLEERVESLEQRVAALEQDEQSEDIAQPAAKPKMSKRPAGGSDAFMGG
jgi:hypothetical protein